MATLSFEGVNFVHAVAMSERMALIPRMKYMQLGGNPCFLSLTLSMRALL